MKKLLLLFLSLMLTTAFGSGLEKIKPLDAQTMQQENKAIIVDVRESKETQEGMVKEALLAPLSLMQNNRGEWEKIVATFPADKTVIVYCASGRRSEVVGSELVKLGFKVLNMGGFEAWEKAGLPVERNKISKKYL